MTDLPRLRPEPIPVIHPLPEYLAGGPRKIWYEDMKQVFQVPWMGVVTMAYAHYPTFYEILWQGVRAQGPFRKSRSDASSEQQQHARAGGAAFVDGTVGLRGFAERIGVVDSAADDARRERIEQRRRRFLQRRTRGEIMHVPLELIASVADGQTPISESIVSMGSVEARPAARRREAIRARLAAMGEPRVAPEPCGAATLPSEAAKVTKGANRFHVEGLARLSRTATKFLRQHPKEARMVVAAALEAAAVQHKAESEISAVDVPESLKGMLPDHPDLPDVLSKYGITLIST